MISGEREAVEEACTRLKEAGAKRALVLPVVVLSTLGDASGKGRTRGSHRSD